MKTMIMFALLALTLSQRVFKNITRNVPEDSLPLNSSSRNDGSNIPYLSGANYSMKTISKDLFNNNTNNITGLISEDSRAINSTSSNNESLFALEPFYSSTLETFNQTHFGVEDHYNNSNTTDFRLFREDVLDMSTQGLDNNTINETLLKSKSENSIKIPNFNLITDDQDIFFEQALLGLVKYVKDMIQEGESSDLEEIIENLKSNFLY